MAIIQTPPIKWVYIALSLGLVGVIYALVSNEKSENDFIDSLNAKVTNLEEQLSNVPVIVDVDEPEKTTDLPPKENDDKTLNDEE